MEEHFHQFHLPLPVYHERDHDAYRGVVTDQPDRHRHGLIMISRYHVRVNGALRTISPSTHFIMMRRGDTFFSLRLSDFIRETEWETNFQGVVRLTNLDPTPVVPYTSSTEGRRAVRLTPAEQCVVDMVDHGARTVCIICLGREPAAVECGESHAICQGCVSQWLSQGPDHHPIQTLSPSVPCPHHMCSASIPISDMAKAGFQKDIEKRREWLRTRPKRQDYWCLGCGSWTEYDLMARPPPRRFPCDQCGNTLHVEDRDWDRYAPFTMARQEWVRMQKRHLADDTGFTMCPVCTTRLEHGSECNELVHCHTHICAMCGYHTVPGEDKIPPSHWHTCPLYPPECPKATRELRRRKHHEALHSISA
jgi:hypothetical protein